jgi:hypothetical protein
MKNINALNDMAMRSTSNSRYREFWVVSHSYYTFTTNPVDINRIDALTRAGKSLPEAIDILAKEDYKKM